MAPPGTGTPHDPAHAGGDHPCFYTKNQHRLEHEKGKPGQPQLRSAPSLLRILVNLRHTARTFYRFLNTDGQSLSASEITRPKYLKEFIIYRGRPYVLKALDVTALSYYAARRRLFR